MLSSSFSLFWPWFFSPQPLLSPVPRGQGQDGSGLAAYSFARSRKRWWETVGKLAPVSDSVGDFTFWFNTNSDTASKPHFPPIQPFIFCCLCLWALTFPHTKGQAAWWNPHLGLVWGVCPWGCLPYSWVLGRGMLCHFGISKDAFLQSSLSFPFFFPLFFLPNKMSTFPRLCSPLPRSLLRTSCAPLSLAPSPACSFGSMSFEHSKEAAVKETD